MGTRLILEKIFIIVSNVNTIHLKWMRGSSLFSQCHPLKDSKGHKCLTDKYFYFSQLSHSGRGKNPTETLSYNGNGKIPKATKSKEFKP